MRLIRIYIRVLSLLGTSARLAWVLAIANLALAATLCVPKIRFGTDAGSQGADGVPC
jgi:hypothetical protein